MQNKNIYYADEINNLANSDEQLLIDMSEKMFQNQIDEVVGDILQKKIKIVLLAGPSSSGSVGIRRLWLLSGVLLNRRKRTSSINAAVLD